MSKLQIYYRLEEFENFDKKILNINRAKSFVRRKRKRFIIRRYTIESNLSYTKV